MSHVYLGLPGTSRDVLAKSQLNSLVSCPRCPLCTWDYFGHPKMSQLRASYTALSHGLYVTCVPEIIWDILGHPGMSQLEPSYIALSHVPNVPCVPEITWDILG